MLGKIELDVRLQGGQDETSSPALAFPMCHGPADCSSRGKEEEVDMRICLRDDGKVAVELGV